MTSYEFLINNLEQFFFILFAFYLLLK